MSLPNAIEVITLFVEGIAETKAFYRTVFDPVVVYEDAVSCVLGFQGTMVNLLEVSEAPLLVQPVSPAPARSGVSALLTIKVADVDGVCATLREQGVTLLNGPIDRPWGRRTAAFADPSGHVWEIAADLK